MRHNLGLRTASSLALAAPRAGDPMRGARQPIRSRAAGREYVERQLVHAEATIQELRTKLHHARREKDAAVEAARLATVAKNAAKDTLILTEAALTAEKAARDRGDRALREAQTTIRDLQTGLDDAARNFETAKADLPAERQARLKPQDCGERPRRHGRLRRPSARTTRSRQRSGDRLAGRGRPWRRRMSRHRTGPPDGLRRPSRSASRSRRSVQ